MRRRANASTGTPDPRNRVNEFRYLSIICAVGLGVGCSGGGGEPTGTGTSGVDLRIETLYLVQSVQTREGTVPLVADKDAYLRVFVVASGANTLTPSVRVRLSRNGTTVQTLTIPASGSSVPTSVDQSSMAKSWNVKIAAATIQPGLQILADVDPTNSIPESNEQNNNFPTNGSPAALQISALQPFRIRFVPMVQAENGRTGRITASNIEDYLTFTRKIHPVSSIDAEVRAAYTVQGLGFDPQGNTWQAAVAELDAVRVAEGSNRFYYGVVNTDYNGGGVVGIAAGIPAGASLGWDRMPDAPITVAHEIGHDWGRRHAPCGGAGGPDPLYPYPLGMIGVYGLDVETQEVKLPGANTDIMGYCDARFWISDYNYSAIFDYRLSHPSASVAPVPSLLVWGRIENDVPMLEPAFEVTTSPSLPATPGPYLIEGRDAAGKTVFSVSFAAERMPDVADDVRHFAFAVPISAEESGRIAALRLVARGRESIRRAPTMRAVSSDANHVRVQSPQAIASVRKVTPERVSVVWDANPYPLVVVRDALTGAILSLARGGSASVATNGGDVSLVLSDGIHSVPNRPR
jgi:hypothetical protein